MGELYHSIEIEAPKAFVYALLSNLESVADYNPLVEHARYVSEKLTGPGASRECSLGKHGIVRERVIDSVEGFSISMEVFEHKWPIEYFRWTTTLEEMAGKTNLTQFTEYQLKFGILGYIMDKLIVNRIMAKQIENILTGMRSHISKHCNFS
ncbi:SRPBCC family protein [Gilvimarinus algae]|uniref:SRPBCC family protein n=1 Tax=Gilvimarinus algae TaxID=3058037 RepID=A0ABT8TA85_9GAMM|nr:SRPBCC family protein [Gilvimarinus sp. SDUM040014]MDO3380913.1 SRPBCC family protein [Gilvimarinus sp. SDUM040014]